MFDELEEVKYFKVACMVNIKLFLHGLILSWLDY